MGGPDKAPGLQGQIGDLGAIQMQSRPAVLLQIA